MTEEKKPGARHIGVLRSARYHLIGPDDGSAREVWFVLHGYGQLAGAFLRRFETLDDGTRLVVAPEGLSRFYVESEIRRHGPRSRVGASWMTRDDREREIEDYVRYLDALAGETFGRLDRARVGFTVLGFSQGVATAARWAVMGSWPPDRLVLWGDPLPPDLPDERAVARLSALELVSVVGRADRTRRERAERAERERLEAWGVERTVVLWEGGHVVDPDVLAGLTAPDAGG